MSKSKYNTTWIQDTKPDNYDDPEHDLVYKRQAHSVPSLKTHIKNTCNIVTNNLAMDYKGRVFNCRCSGHAPFSLGYAHEFNTFDEIFNSPIGTKHRQSVDSKQFIYCATQFCGIEGNNLSQYSGKYYIALEMDFSCNLTCPSCRNRMIFVNDPKILKEYDNVIDNLCKWIQSTEKQVVIEFCGGDSYASIYYESLIKRLVQFKNTIVLTRTNGLLLLKNADVIENHLSQILLSISIDAASKDVYEKVRRGGKWTTLIENLEYVKRLTDANPTFLVESRFTIQRDNLDDVIPFLEFSKKYNLRINYGVMEDWGVWIDKYEENCAHLPSSPVFEKFIKIINDPIFKEYGVYIDNLKHWEHRAK